MTDTPSTSAATESQGWPDDLKRVPVWRWKWHKRWHNLFCAECRPCYTFWRVRGIPLSEQRRNR